MLNEYFVKTYVRLLKNDNFYLGDVPSELRYEVDVARSRYQDEISGMTSEEIAEKEAFERDMAIIKLFEMIKGR